MRSVNISVERFATPIAAEVRSERRAFVAEVAFELLKLKIARAQSRLHPGDLQEAAARVRPRISALGAYPEDQIEDPSALEQREALRLAASLEMFLRLRRASTVTVNPEVPGCGIVDRATVDLLIRRYAALDIDSMFHAITERKARPQEDVLYEVKAVDRGFRAIDFRQLITYAALMTAGGAPPAAVGLVNPRRGVCFECSLDELTVDVAGVYADELLQRIIYDVSSVEVST